MKRLTDLLADNILSQKSTTEGFQKLIENLQQNDGNLVLGNQNSYLEIGQSGINLVSNGRKLTFDQLLSILDFVQSVKVESTDGSDQDEGLQDPDDDEIPFPDDEDLLLPDADEPAPVPFQVQATTIMEISSGTIPVENRNGWNLRRLNLIFPDVDWASLDSGRFVLEPGTYQLIARTPALSTDYLLSRFSGGGIVWEGSFSETINGAISGQSFSADSFIFLSLNIRNRASISLETYVGDFQGFGALGAIGGAASADNNLSGQFVFSQIMVTKLA